MTNRPAVRNCPEFDACYFCNGLWDSRVIVIHHLDHDPTNNVPSNLVKAHMDCHTRYHNSKGGQVHYRKGRDRWVARKMQDGRRVYVGMARTEAGAWRLLEEEKA
jgi:hypothetical protein